MRAYSKDLRRRILEHALNHSIRQTAEVFHISPDTVFRLKKLYLETGDIDFRPRQAKSMRAVSPEGELWLQAVIAESPDLTLAELCARYKNAYGVSVGATTMFNTT